ncbi:MAG: hypothetical protein QOH31_2101 [Verrucomicrobiota bacterium]|jgi:hypothetical protein
MIDERFDYRSGEAVIQDSLGTVAAENNARGLPGLVSKGSVCRTLDLCPDQAELETKHVAETNLRCFVGGHFAPI